MPVSYTHLEEVALAVAGAHFLDRLQGFGQRLGEARSAVVLQLLQVLDLLTLVGTSAILIWMHWQLALLILLFNPLVIYATVLLLSLIHISISSPTVA